MQTLKYEAEELGLLAAWGALEGSQQERGRIRFRVQEGHSDCHLEDRPEWEAESWHLGGRLGRRKEAGRKMRAMENDGLLGRELQDEAWRRMGWPERRERRDAEVKTK